MCWSSGTSLEFQVDVLAVGFRKSNTDTVTACPCACVCICTFVTRALLDLLCRRHSETKTARRKICCDMVRIAEKFNSQLAFVSTGHSLGFTIGIVCVCVCLYMHIIYICIESTQRHGGPCFSVLLATPE